MFALFAKKSSDFSYTCDNYLRICSKDHLLCHNKNKGNHDPIDLETTTQKVLFKNNTNINENNAECEKISNRVKYKSTKFSNDLQEIKRILKFDLNLIIEGHSSSVNSVVVMTNILFLVLMIEQ